MQVQVQWRSHREPLQECPAPRGRLHEEVRTILLVSVPATIMTSLCRGLGLKMMPNLSKSYRAAPECIISTAQHARPKVIGHIEPLRAQLTRSSTCNQSEMRHAEASIDILHPSYGCCADTWMPWTPHSYPVADSSLRIRKPYMHFAMRLAWHSQ
jgi:hypothetical protein